MRTMKATMLMAMTILVFSSLSGCSSTKDSVIPPSSVSISDVYQNHTTNNSKQKMRFAVNVPLSASDTDIDAYELHGMKRNKFKLLPNPTLYMYVNTRISEVDRAPIPAFITEFKLFERDEYALPSEVNINWSNK